MHRQAHFDRARAGLGVSFALAALVVCVLVGPGVLATPCPPECPCEVISDALGSAQVMRRALLGQATSEIACLGDAPWAEVSSDHLEWAKVWAKVLRSTTASMSRE